MAFPCLVFLFPEAYFWTSSLTYTLVFPSCALVPLSYSPGLPPCIPGHLPFPAMPDNVPLPLSNEARSERYFPLPCSCFSSTPAFRATARANHFLTVSEPQKTLDVFLKTLLSAAHFLLGKTCRWNTPSALPAAKAGLRYLRFPSVWLRTALHFLHSTQVLPVHPCGTCLPRSKVRL